LTHAYEGVTVLHGLSLSVSPGQIVGLLGPNGAGKTTAMKIIAGQLRPDGGTVSLSDRCLDGLATYQRAQLGVRYLPQEPSVFRDCTVLENMQMAVEGLKGEVGQIAVQLEARGIAHLSSAKASSLSGGERRRLELARSMVAKPAVLILDEPFSGIDPVGIEGLQASFRSLAAEGIGVLITDHAVRATLGICDSAVILDAGTVMAEGCPEDVAADIRVRERYLGEGFRLEKCPNPGNIGR